MENCAQNWEDEGESMKEKNNEEIFNFKDTSLGKNDWEKWDGTRYERWDNFLPFLGPFPV